MNRKELRALVKSRFSALGFKAYKSFLYKIIDDDYLIGFYLEPTGYGKEYEFVYGVLYLPDDEQDILQDRRFDITMCFEFPWEPDDPLAANCMKMNMSNWALAYERYTIEEVNEMLDKNFHLHIEPFLDKSYGLKIFRQDWRSFRGLSDARLILLCARAELDIAEVCAYLGRPVPDSHPQ